MNCPKCGAEIPQGSLYCVECGEDIHIVPDFEPEMESNLEETILKIAEEFREEAAGELTALEAEEQPAKERKSSASIWIPLGILLVVLLTAGAAMGVVLKRYNSFAYQVEKARKYAEAERYERAVAYYKRALDLDGDNVEVKFALSDVYFRKNNKIEYEYLLRDIAMDPDATTEQLESAYGKLIAIYRSREDFKTINELLENCVNESIRNKFQNYVAEPPEFSVEEGYYFSLQPLKLSSLAAGTIYYTTDGSLPDETSDMYTAPILLDEGDHIIRACFVNEYGIVSESVTKQYHIVVEELPIPVIATLSGEYSHPIDIEVLDDEENIYYTTDGSNPTASSQLYTEPIPMPLGRSEFKFARIDEGKSSDVVECTYRLKLDTDVTVQDAEWSVIQYAMNTGRIMDPEGHIAESTNENEMYKYQLQYVRNIEGSGDYYVIAEVYYDGGAGVRTGTYFAVNVYENVLYRLQVDGDNNIKVIEIEG